MWIYTGGCVATSPLLLPVGSAVGSKSQFQARVRHARPNIVRMQSLPNFRKGQLKIAKSQSLSPRIICAAALNARCAAEQTQTIKRESRTINLTPGKEKSPILDDNGPGFPPGSDDGNGGNGGGGGKFSGGLILLGILGFLDILKEMEGEWLRKKGRKLRQA